MSRLVMSCLLMMLVRPAVAGVCDGVAADVNAVAAALNEPLCRYAVTQGWLRDEGTITPAALANLVRARGGKDLLEAGADMFAVFEREASQRTYESGWVMRKTDHYVFLARPGSPAANDLALIAVEAERTREALASALDLEELLRVRQTLLQAKLPEDATPQDGGNRIVVCLYSNRADVTKGRIGQHGMGSSQFGATIADSGQGRLQLTIHVLYFNAFSLAVVQHEVAHLVAMLAAFNPEPLQQQLDGERALRKAFMSGYQPIPPFLNEGLGDYGLYYAGMYERWNALGSPEALARTELNAGRIPPLKMLLTADAVFHAREHKTFSLAAATFLKYLLTGNRPELVRRWLLAPGKNAARSFETTSGMKVEQAEKAWHRWLVAVRPE